MDWRAFRASLVLKEQLKPRSTPPAWGSPWGTYTEPQLPPSNLRQPGHWAHEISAPERGCLLVARNMANQDTLLHQSVVLLCSHATGEPHYPWQCLLESGHQGSESPVRGMKLKQTLAEPYSWPCWLHHCTHLAANAKYLRVHGCAVDWDVKEPGGDESTAMSRRSGPSSGFILNKPCLHKRVQEINLRAGLAGMPLTCCCRTIIHMATSAQHARPGSKVTNTQAAARAWDFWSASTI